MNTRVSEYQSIKSFKNLIECYEPRGGLSQNEKTSIEERTAEAEQQQEEIPNEPVAAAIALGEQIAEEQVYRKTFEGEALWTWPFRLARRLKRFENDLTTAWAERAVRAFAETIYQGWPRWRSNRCPVAYEELWVGFLEAWQKARLPEGQDALERAVYLAKERTLRLTSGLPELCCQVASVAYYLSALSDEEGVILLPQERLATAFGVSQVSVSRCISLLVRQRILEAVSAEWSRNKRQAKTYRWCAEAEAY